MKRNLAVLLGIAALLGGSTVANAAGDPTPKDVEARCLKTTTVSMPLPDPIRAFTVYSRLSMICTISLVDAAYHPETKLFYSIDQFTMVSRKNDEVPFTPKGRTYSQTTWKPMRKVGTNLFIADFTLERKVQNTTKWYEWQGQASVSYQIKAMDHENNQPIWDVNSTGLKVSAISELKFK